MKQPSSLRLRLVVGSILSILVALLAVGVLITLLFRGHIERRFDHTLNDHLEEIAAAAEVENGEVRLSWEPADPRFQPPLSGWYWELRSGGETLRRSPSLVRETLPAEAPGLGRPAHIADAAGPAGQQLRIMARHIRLAGQEALVAVLVAGPCDDIRNDVLAFVGNLALSLAALALALGGLAVVQISYGLAPLARVQEAVNRVRTGARSDLDEAQAPIEVRPLIAEMNALIAERQAAVERARAEAGDLAHALKTPIAIVANEARALGGASGATISAETDRMRRVVEHHLVRARAAAGARTPGARAPLAAALADIRFGLERLHPDRELVVAAEEGLAFAGDADDLAEMIGNLADNAAKWAVRRVLIQARCTGSRLRLSVEDDGPGIDGAARSAALERGGRLDTQQPGHGLGLAIVAQLAELHGGKLSLSRSPLDRKSTRLNSSHNSESRMPSSA
jgi:signal transduction histidine kinase